MRAVPPEGLGVDVDNHYQVAQAIDCLVDDVTEMVVENSDMSELLARVKVASDRKLRPEDVPEFLRTEEW